MATATKQAKGAKVDLVDTFAEMMREDKAEVVERNTEVELLWLCLLARQHMLLLGDPGVAKSMLLRLLHRHVQDANYFERLVFKQSPAEEILGPVSLAALENDRYERVTTGKLPEAHIAFIDEVFKANATILNGMLSIINERIFHNNGGVVQVPLWTCAFASNELPGLDRDDLRAFRDRIPVTKIVEDVRSDESFKSVLRGQVARRMIESSSTATAQAITRVTLDQVQTAHQAVDAVTIPDTTQEELARLRRMCLEEGLSINPRRFHQGVTILQAKAWLTGRTEVLVDDLQMMKHIIPREPEDFAKAQRIVLDFASEYERAAARFQDDLDPIRAEFQELRAKGSIDPNNDDDLKAAVRVKRLYDALSKKVAEKVASARADGRDSSSLDEIAATIHGDMVWLNENAFGTGV